MVTYCRIFLVMRNISDTLCEKNKKKQTLCSITYFYSENRAVYEIMWKNVAQTDRPCMTQCNMEHSLFMPDK